ncbi:ESX secretion-associated protein EspG [Nocardia sp. BMG51109]|uniref:ESX secretion-associated protein EspG n=1 Tax=Nocardia sp. BMG51109 TaxID=1056816 RepID=UPI000463D8EC|nr:ESX secretion-associated protein EspG [Nocardia sp. BMG51109]
MDRFEVFDDGEPIAPDRTAQAAVAVDGPSESHSGAPVPRERAPRDVAFTAVWRFTDLEFVVAWEPVAESTVPIPFVYTSRFRLRRDNEREKEQARARLRDRLGDEFRPVLETLARPDIRIVVRGRSGGASDPLARIRILAARRGDRGYVVDQEPGETKWRSAGFTVWQVDPLRLGAAVAGLLPGSPAGRLGVVELAEPADDLEHGLWLAPAKDTVHDPRREGRNRFRTAARGGAGSIDISQGASRFGPRGVTRRGLEWADLVADGRYVITGPPRRAVPVGDDGLRAAIDGAIAEVVQAIRDEWA